MEPIMFNHEPGPKIGTSTWNEDKLTAFYKEHGERMRELENELYSLRDKMISECMDYDITDEGKEYLAFAVKE